MIIHPVVPIQPILPKIIPIPTFTRETALAVLTAILMIGLSVLVGWLLTTVMQKKGFKTSLALNLILPGAMALACFLRFGFSVVAVQGIVLTFILLYASCSDLTSHTMDDYLWVMVGILGLCSVGTVGLPSMLIGAAMVFVPQILIALIPPHNSLGGADIKLSTAIAFLLGWQKGLAALMIGLLLAVVVMLIVNKIKNRKKKQAFALIPFLSVASLIMFLV